MFEMPTGCLRRITSAISRARCERDGIQCSAGVGTKTPPWVCRNYAHVGVAVPPSFSNLVDQATGRRETRPVTMQFRAVGPYKLDYIRLRYTDVFSTASTLGACATAHGVTYVAPHCSRAGGLCVDRGLYSARTDSLGPVPRASAAGEHGLGETPEDDVDSSVRRSQFAVSWPSSARQICRREAKSLFTKQRRPA